MSKVRSETLGIATVPKKLSPFSSGCSWTRDSGTVVPSKLLSPLSSTTFLKWTGYLREMPLTLTWVSPSTLTRRVSLMRTHVLKTVKAFMSRMSTNCVRLTADWDAEVVCGNCSRAKGVCGSQSSRNMTPSKGSMTAWMLSSARSVLLMDMVKFSDCACERMMPWMVRSAPSTRCWAILGTATKILVRGVSVGLTGPLQM